MGEKPKIVSMRGGEILPPGVPRPNVITLCERLLERAQSGDLAGLYAAMLHDDGASSYEAVGPSSYAAVGAVEVLKSVMARDVAG